MAVTPRRPYQDQVDQFLANYSDQFLPTLVTGKQPAAPAMDTTPNTQLAGKDLVQQNVNEMLSRSVHPDTMNTILEGFRGQKALPGPWNSPEGQRALSERATPIPHVTTGFTPRGAGRESPGPAQAVFNMDEGGGAIDMTPNPQGVFERPLPPGGDTFFQYNRPNGSVGFTDRESAIPMGSTGIALRNFVDTGRGIFGGEGGGGSAIPLSYTGGSAIPMGGGQGFELPSDIRDSLKKIEKTLMTPSGAIYSPSGRQAFGGGYRKTEKETLAAFAKTLEQLGATGANFQAKMAELGAEAPGRAALADYYNRMAGVHEAAIPSEIFARQAQGMHALSESQRPFAMAPGSAVYQGAKMLGYVPEKSEAIHPIIKDIINKSQTLDPATGQPLGFDIRGARQKIGFLVPFLRGQGVEIPKEAYKMTKPEFQAEQKEFVSRLPKKERAKYTAQYSEGLWNEYWGKD